ncbi:MAG: DUF1993 domain-containing protein [Gammaproteobacteria bacterium]|nr:DUF1993 domain-containing protein [Gammaproteobacteria bacterium]
MTASLLVAAVQTFDSRLATLAHLLDMGAAHCAAEGDALLARRLAPDMLPLGTQVAFTCNQPHNFCRWLAGEAPRDLDPALQTLAAARACLDATRAALGAARLDESLLDAPFTLELGNGLFAELSGRQYLDDFLSPNFYFHLVTAYAVLRAAGVPLGKRDYMSHLLPLVRQRSD